MELIHTRKNMYTHVDSSLTVRCVLVMQVKANIQTACQNVIPDLKKKKYNNCDIFYLFTMILLNIM